MSTKFAVSRAITTTVFLCGLFALPGLAVAAERPLGADPVAACAALSGAGSGAIKVDASALTEAKPMAVAERGPTPSARISPATPQFCRVLGHIAPVDPKAPPIRFQVNLPPQWNGRSVQYGGGGFNGVLITGLAPAAGRAVRHARRRWRGALQPTAPIPATRRSPASRRRCSPLNDEALVNFAHASYKKVRDVAVVLMERAYGARRRSCTSSASPKAGAKA